MQSQYVSDVAHVPFIKKDDKETTRKNNHFLKRARTGTFGNKREKMAELGRDGRI
jgi:hypothetical protein